MPTIAFPAISAGSYNYPKELAAEVACETVRKFLEKKDNQSKINLIIFVMWEDNMPIYVEQMLLSFPAGSFPLALGIPGSNPPPALNNLSTSLSTASAAFPMNLAATALSRNASS